MVLVERSEEVQIVSCGNVLGKQLRKLRKEKSLTQEEVGALLGKTKFNISNYEMGRRQPNNDALIAFAKLFHVSTDYLLGVSDIRSRVGTQD